MDNLNEDDALDRRLRDAAPYIDDDGFSGRVLRQLPASSRARSPIRAMILIGMTLLASFLTYFLFDGGNLVNQVIARLAGLPMLWLLLLTFCTGIVASSLGLIAAISKTRQSAT
ncbi:MAG: hypothetical protein QOI34_1035 [Verrucomicrobiota bacterium]|jgi:hypothetical protein